MTCKEVKKMYDIIKRFDRPSPELVDRFSKVGESASIYEVMKAGAMDPDIRPIWPGLRMCGTALTVKTRPGDNLMLHKAIDMARPGEVIVLDCGGYTRAGGMCGGLMAASMKSRGVAGFVTNGAVRDTMDFKRLGVPAFSRGIAVEGSTKAHGGSINHPIVVGGVVVEPGDIIFGDHDAVVVVPRKIAEEVLLKTNEREAEEDTIMQDILEGKYVTFDLGYREAFDALGLSEED